MLALVLTACGTEENNHADDSASEEQTDNAAAENEESNNADDAHEEKNHDHENNHSHKDDQEDNHNHDHENDHSNEENHDHDHDHSHDEEDQDIYDGYFDDEQIEDRELSDWEGEWQSVYPYLMEGELDPVMEQKAAEDESMTAEEYTSYYETGYETDVDYIDIQDDTFTFYTEESEMGASYTYDGYEVLTYEAGNRGVRYIFAKDDGDEEMPEFIQFSDHAIFPTDAHHFHLYWGDDREQLLEEVTNWPTYYPAHMDEEEIREEMLAH
ncbi:MAG: metal-binding protein ZinT [Alkalicoccus sp.]|nr:MAG: metal-binding protein ZinT [Alkalicoccus sp.]